MRSHQQDEFSNFFNLIVYLFAPKKLVNITWLKSLPFPAYRVQRSCWAASNPDKSCFVSGHNNHTLMCYCVGDNCNSYKRPVVKTLESGATYFELYNPPQGVPDILQRPGIGKYSHCRIQINPTWQRLHTSKFQPDERQQSRLHHPGVHR